MSKLIMDIQVLRYVVTITVIISITASLILVVTSSMAALYLGIIIAALTYTAYIKLAKHVSIFIYKLLHKS